MAIEDFDVSINLLADSTFFVTETIDVDFGSVQKHGIFRTIPVDYARDETVAGLPIGTRYSIRLRVLSVIDGNGQPRPYSTWREGRSLFVRIGDPNATVSGRQIYTIHYRVQRAINYFETHDELYWNVTGTEWDWPIRRAHVRVILPREVPTDALQHKTFTGRFGTRTTTAVERVTPLSYEADAAGLGPGEGLTIVLGLPRGTLEPPSPLREFGWKLADNVSFFLVALVPIATFAILLTLYLRTGRDPGAGDPIVVQYAPPEELSPAEVGALVDERIDVPDIISTVIDLAVRGYLEIQEEETKVLFFFTHKDYRFTKLTEDHGKLSSHEKTFFNGLFESGDSVLLSSLTNKFYRHIPQIRRNISRQMLTKKVFPRDPEKVRQLYRGLAMVAVIAPPILGGFLLSSGRLQTVLLPPNPGALILFGLASLALTWLVVNLFARAMPVKTPKGAKLARQCLGFKEFVTRVEKDRIERMASEDPTVFERLLPYAIVLGVGDAWAERFEGLLREPPTWYHSLGSHPGSPFRAQALVSDLGRGMQSIGSTLTSRPSSSGGGGGSWGGSGGGGGFSGFSGGGGSSGGGFGGGGGGSW